ncbi:MAG: NFACT RNA binding domain-containing protein [Vicinamibacteria bacterium]|nr:NFACT RNA binding domain-containing protein [Vicinamibacteria bacterium]
MEGPSRTAALLFKKHLEGARVEELVAGGDRIVSLRTAHAAVLLRPWGAPGATLRLDGDAIAHFGGGERVEFGEPDDNPKPAAATVFLTPPPSDDATNALKPPRLVVAEPGEPAAPFPNFTAAGAALYILQRRADLLRERAQSHLSRAKSEVSRLTRLRAALERDRGRWPDPAELRRHAEALLAAPPDLTPEAPRGRDVIALSVPDPRTGDPLEIRIQPNLNLPQNANALYTRARNIERQKDAFDKRWAAVISDLEEAELALDRARALRSLEDIEAPAPASIPDPHGGGGRKRYLTSRGLEILFGRSASENHDVTFRLAKREDIWLHVLDAPGGHVVLRNPQGRVTPVDIAEAASLAAFLSERRTEANVDVQYTERKHVQSAGGGKGRVRVSHAEVIRVKPQDPVGRLRAR